MAQTDTKAQGEGKAPDRMARAWELALNLPDYRRAAVVEYIEFLASREEQDDVWEPGPEEDEAIRAWLAGEGEPGIPLEEVMRESEELGENVLD